ncbi:hypothetical protein CEXT_164831 [Caerostris extrusa]|uniref:Uncharacterized protein n=1 Tax=Caerostris extrusa TaxID=172846 RepID=A0AAV4YAX1_CAEEX|nr:hypothetical protein CEXT_164831 [Caerostris extrusa]
MQNVRYSVQVFSQKQNSSTGSKNTLMQIHSCRDRTISPAHSSLALEMKTQIQNLDHQIETYETWKQKFGEIPHHLEETAS